MSKNTKNTKNIIIFTIIALLSLIMVFGIPIAINEAYKLDKGYTTLWSATDVLSYYAVILSGIITVFVLFATIHHNKEICNKQLHSSKVPFFVINKISSEDSGTFIKNDNNSLKLSFTHDLNGIIIVNPKINIYLTNIGDATIGKPICCSRYSAVECCTNINHKTVVIGYNIQKCINEHWEARNRNSDTYFCDTIFLENKNIYGISFKQSIVIDYTLDHDDVCATISVDDTGPIEEAY